MSKAPFIAVNATPAMSGHFATLWTWDREDEMYYPWTSGFGRYTTWQEAEVEAAHWAEDEGIEHRKLTQEIVDKCVTANERSRQRAARVRQLRDEGLDLRAAYRQAKEEMPD